MANARAAVERLDAVVRRLDSYAEPRAADNAGYGKLIQDARAAFAAGLDDDLNISAALGFLFETIRETNRAFDQGTLSPAEARSWLAWWQRIDRVLALTAEETDARPPAEVAALAEARGQARLAKEWGKSDELRDRLADLGWEVRDTKDGQKITRRAGF